MVKQLILGTRIESEHKPTYDFLKSYENKFGKLPPSKLFFRAIAQNHLDEDKNYYKKLRRCKI